MYNTLIENPRKLEFRAWDIPKGKFLDYCLWCRQDNFEQFMTFDRWFNMKEEGIILMQFTGLLDKENRKIFEGDIVRFGKNNPPPIDRSARILEGIVEWEPAGAMFVVVVYDKEEPDVVVEIHELRFSEKIFTVVGNVFEGAKP